MCIQYQWTLRLQFFLTYFNQNYMFQNKGFVLIIAKSQFYFYNKTTKLKKTLWRKGWRGSTWSWNLFFSCLLQQLAPRHCIINGNQNTNSARGRNPLTTTPQAKDKTKPELVFSHTNNHLKSPMCDVILDLVSTTFGLELIYNPWHFFSNWQAFILSPLESHQTNGTKGP
jgi:hypothetical protein